MSKFAILAVPAVPVITAIPVLRTSFTDLNSTDKKVVFGKYIRINENSEVLFLCRVFCVIIYLSKV